MKSLLEVQFPIAQFSLESYIERKPYVGKLLGTLGKWWGTKPLVLTRGIILASLFPASEDTDSWPDDLEIFLRLMTFDPDGMWSRKTKPISAGVCYGFATEEERENLFEDSKHWFKGDGLDREEVQEKNAWKAKLEKRIFFGMSHNDQRAYCCRIEQVKGPPKESWDAINSYLGTKASNLQEWVEEMSLRKFNKKIRVGDAFSGMGSIPFEAAELGCEVYASDLNPVACLMSWVGLNVIAGSEDLNQRLLQAQEQVYAEVDQWFLDSGYDTSEEGWRAEVYLYCLEIEVPEWDGWKVPISSSWEVSQKLKARTVLVPNLKEKRFDFSLEYGGTRFNELKKGTKQGNDIVCPEVLWKILQEQGKTDNAQRQIKLRALIDNNGGLRNWDKTDVRPRPADFFQERLYCIRWRNEEQKVVYREPTQHDLRHEEEVALLVEENLSQWQDAELLPSWRIQPGYNTNQPMRERGWAHWHHLFTPRQLLLLVEYSRRIAELKSDMKRGLLITTNRLLDYNSRLCSWLPSDSGGLGHSKHVFFNQALNTMPNHATRGVTSSPLVLKHKNLGLDMKNAVVDLRDCRTIEETCDIWITDPPYADAVNYEELSEFFLWFCSSHIKAAFPGWYADSKRDIAVKGDDAPFRVAMAECYSRLNEKMPEDGIQVLMFTHKDTEVWEDLALIMWAAGLQVKQVWSIATETGSSGVKQGNYVQATYNMVLRKRPKDAEMGFVDFITPIVTARVKEVIGNMRESQVEAGGFLQCGYTDTDYLLAAQAVAAEVVTGYSSIDGIDLKAELAKPNSERGESALRRLMNNAKRVATDFLVPPLLDKLLKASKDGSSSYNFWREMAVEEKFLFKGLELEAVGVSKIGVFQDLGRGYGMADYDSLTSTPRANEARTLLPDELGRPSETPFTALPVEERRLFGNSITRQLYWALALLKKDAEPERAGRHVVNCTDFWQLRESKILVILDFLIQATANNEAWYEYQSPLRTLKLTLENWKA